MDAVRSVVGYHDVNNVQGRELLMPYLGTNGHYILRPPSDRNAGTGIVCTICVTNNNKITNYRLCRDPTSGNYFIFPHTTFPNIQLLLAHYKATPINADLNTRLLSPVTQQEQQPHKVQHQLEDNEDIYGVLDDYAVRSVVGYHDVNNVQGRELLMPYLGTNGHYILRPPSDRNAGTGIVCTICVTNNNNKITNYRLCRDPTSGNYFIFPHTTFPNIQLLLAHYKATPISADLNTCLLSPVTQQEQQPHKVQHQLEDNEDIYGVLDDLIHAQKAAAVAKDDSQISCLYEYLPKSELNTVMNSYLKTDGWYLLRPSSTSEGQLNLAVTHDGQILHFKIESEGDQFYIATKKRFHSVQALLEYYKTTPIRSKKYGNQTIRLLYPIPVDKEQEETFKQKLAQKVATKLSKTNPEPLPEPWEEYFEKHYQRYYYYNPQTRESTWERPSKDTKSLEDIQREQEHLAAIQEAIDKHGKFSHSIVRGVFVGPARSGKDSLMKRLQGEMALMKSPSTGVADGAVYIKVEKSLSSSSVMANIEGSVWKPIKKNDHDKAIDLTLKIASTHTREEATNSPIQQQEADIEHTIDSLGRHQSFSEIEEHSIESKGIIVASQPTDISPLEIIKTAIRTKGLKGHEQDLDKQVSLYLTNTGGQMEFQELLPLLVSGPSMFFITFRLDRDLNTPYEIVYEMDVQSGDSTQLKSYKYTSSNTPLDTILQSLASIDAIGTYSQFEKRNVSLTYRVFLIGTHRDMLEKNTSNVEFEIMKIDKQINDAVEMAAYRKHIIHAKENRLIFTVNNFAKDDKDFQFIRSSVQKVIDAGEFRNLYPSYWLIYSLMLQRLEKRIESFKKCFEVSQSCGISEVKELKEALHFLDRRMGVIRYFPEDELKDIVILDPQVLFDKVTELIVETFTFEQCYLDRSVLEEFKKGIFSLEEFDKISKRINPDSLINPKWFADLLKHLRIAAPFREDGIQKYFFPCALSHVDEKQTKATPDSKAPPEPLVCPLAVSFKCNYCPIGLTGALITYLMQEKVGSGDWELLTNGIFRDQVTFFVCYTGDKITLRSFPTHLEITCIPGPGNREQCPVEDTCVEVKSLIRKGIEIVTENMNYICNVDATFTFYCTAEKCKGSRKHPAKCIGATGKLRCIKDHSLIFDLPKGHQYWEITSGQAQARHRPPLPPPKPPKSKNSEPLPPRNENQSVIPCIRPALSLLLPLAHQWQNIGTLLDIPDGKLDIIKYNEQGVENHLREMVKLWLKQIDPPPTWSGLAEAVEAFNPSIAEKLRKL